MFAKILNNTVVKYPYQWTDFMADNNNSQGLDSANLLTIFPQTAMAKQGYTLVDVAPSTPPTFDPITQSVTEGTPSLVSGVWTQTWTVTTLDAATQAANLAAAKVAKIAGLANNYATAIAQAVSYTSAVGVVQTYQADPGSISNLQAAIAGCSKAQATPVGFYWVAADNTQVPFSFADLQGLAAVMFGQGAVAFQHLQTLKAEVTAATTSAGIAAIVW